MTNPSPKLDLVMDVREAVAASVAPAAALVVRRLKRDPTAPDAVVWHATAAELRRRGHDVAAMHDRCDADPSLVASLLEASEDYSAPSEVTV